MDESLAVLSSRNACEVLDEAGIDCRLIWVRETMQFRNPTLSLVLDTDVISPTGLPYATGGERIERVIRLTEGIFGDPREALHPWRTERKIVGLRPNELDGVRCGGRVGNPSAARPLMRVRSKASSTSGAPKI